MIRLYNYVKTFGNYTKSEVKDLGNNGAILVNNIVKNLSYIIRENDVVTVNGKIIEPIEYQYYAYNKPIGYVCTNDLNNEFSVIKHLGLNDKFFCVGRLDKMSHGLIIITNDGKFAHDILDSKHHINKEYEVVLSEKIDDKFIELMKESIVIKGKSTIPASISIVDDKTIKVTLWEGKYHQVRKLVANSGNFVQDLKRIRIGKLNLGDLAVDNLVSIRQDEVL